MHAKYAHITCTVYMQSCALRTGREAVHADSNYDTQSTAMNLDESELMSDPKFKAYSAAVDKALKGFEYSSEWADLISALAKLIKVLQSNSTRYSVIPKRLLIGKRLAQCTHPALPSGVHLKALETYDLIFRTIGPKQLCQDMFIYSAGLFPLLGSAAMAVKPKLLHLYEEHYLPLGEHLKPCLTGLLQGIMPGLEEGSEFFDRTNALLEQLCAGMVKSNFYSALWECVLTSPGVRLPAVSFVLSQLDRKASIKEQSHILGNSREKLVKAVCESLYDSVVLVQRSVLDLVLLCFPLHDYCVSKDEQTHILTAALNVLLRRDMSLNRRLFSWLLGTDVRKTEPDTTAKKPTDLTVERSDSLLSTEDETSAYFEAHSKAMLVESLKVWLHTIPSGLNEDEAKAAILKPYKILISLLDKPELSTIIVEDVFIEVFRALFNRCTTGCENDVWKGLISESQESLLLSTPSRKLLTRNARPVELIKTANLLFGVFESHFMWEFIAARFDLCCQETVMRGGMAPSIGDGSRTLTCSEMCKLVDFLLDIVSLETYVETTTEYLPNLLCKLTVSLSNYCEYLSLSEIKDTLCLCTKLLTKVQPSMVTSPNQWDTSTPQRLMAHVDIIEKGLEIVDGGSSGITGRDLSLQQSSTPREMSKSQSVMNSSDGKKEASSGSAAAQDESPESERADKTKQGKQSSSKKFPLSPRRSLDRLSSERLEDAELPALDDDFQIERVKRPTKMASLDSVSKDETIEFRPSHRRTPSSVSLTTSLAESDQDGQPVFIMQACVQCYQTFFAKFVSSKILPEAEVVKRHLKKLNVKYSGTQEKRQPSVGEGLKVKQPHGFGDLTDKMSEDGRLRTNSALTSDEAVAVYIRDVELQCTSSPSALQAFSTACHLLVEFACFPMYCNETASAAHIVTPTTTGSALGLPEWLQSLVATSCFVNNFMLQTTAISTTLELIALTKSVTDRSDTKLVLPNPPNSPKADSGTISVVLIPAVSASHLHTINFGTSFFQRVATSLWHYMSANTPNCHQKSADLLHQLHNVAPDVYICEDIIGNSLVQINKAVSLAAHIKYAQLWHLIRSQILSASPASKVLTFDRSLLVMMDSLECPDCMIRSVTQTWLVHAIDRGDIARLLEPILLVLLHPATARVSVQFLHTKPEQKSGGEGKTDEDGDEDVENRIYSISSVDGEVKYYVIKDGKRAIAINPSKQDPVFACTTIDDKMKYVTNKANSGLRYSVPPQMLSKTLSVTVNPMNQSAYISDTDSDTSSSPKVKVSSSRKPSKEESAEKRKIRKVPDERRPSDLGNLPETLGKATPSTSTDDLCEEPSYVYNEEVDESPEDAVRGILMSVIEEAMRQVDGLGQEGDARGEDRSTASSGSKQSYVVTPASPRSKAGVKSTNLENLSPEDYILDDLENAMSGIETEPSDIEMAEAATEDRAPQGQPKMLPALKLNAVPPLQQHILLYVQVYDAQRMLYVLSTIKTILSTNPWPLVCAMSSTSISSTNTPQLIKLQQLLARHKRCITGQDFYSDLEQEALTIFRSSTYLEIVVLICVYYMRSYYPHDLKASEDDVHGNRDVQIASMEVLRLILHELVYIVKDSGRGLATFISDLLIRSKVQKAVLYCLLSSVFNSHHRGSGKTQSLEPEIILDISQDMSDRGAQAFQIQLLKLARTLIFLEDQLFTLKDDTDTGSNADSEWEYLRMKFTPQKTSSVGFVRSERFGSQSIFITAVLSALKQYQICHMHRHWVAVVTEALPHLERGLPKLALPVCNQLCKNLEQLTILYTPGDSNKKLEVNLENVPPDHVVTMLEGLTTICHFCLLESTSNLSAMGSRHSGPVTSSTSALESESSTSTPLLSSLLGALTRDKSKSTANPSSSQTNNPKADARKGLLGMLPRIISSVAKLWAVILRCERLRDSLSKPEEPPSWSFGPPKGTRQQILELLSPIALHHPVNLMAAIGVVWSDWKKKSGAKQTNVVRQACEDQVVLVELVSAIRAMPTDTLMQTIKQVLKAPPFTIRDKDQPGLETSMLQFVFCYIGRMSIMSVRDSWQSLLSLLKEGLQLGLAPPGQFLLLRILSEIVHKIPAFEDRKDQKELQEVTQRLVEACNTIAGSSLEQSTWLRRNVSVKINPQEQTVSQTDEPDGGDSTSEMTSVTTTDPSTPFGTPTNSPKNYSQYSVQALNLLAELLATLLDMVYGSDEKDKVVPLLTSIMHNVTPYLKNHSSPNTPSFRACTALLASLSGYQYTRKSWKKDAFDLLLDPSFFQVDIVSIHNWLPVIDNLMTHDKTTYRDLMARVAAFQNTSLNLFTSKEAEIDQRAQLLKRLSFTIFCSETDQYVRFLPDIQERLAENLRQSQGPAVHEQVFVCFRVLLLRISPHHLTGLWPTVISELVQVFLHMEEQLTCTPESSKKSVIKRVTSTDFASFFLGGNGNIPQTLSNVAKPWLGLYLAACKLLDLAICLPAESLPQFQVYKWAFVGGGKKKDSPMQFVPHVSRAAQLLRTRYKQENGMDGPALKVSPGRPLLTMYQIKSIEELLPFFNTICPESDTSLVNQIPDLIQLEREVKTSSSGRGWKIEDLVDVEDLPPLDLIEKLMERDFLIPLAAS
ncbi:protein dopey-1-like isoform X2 [Acanthaster planci]|uniref:Protein dopey-1-like isoform X2 n=1 Tax=Acanthaster planci TaxID=133434 RepID=A0A8B7YDS0_ACAPL|nr:protein dopey-1-like isoform X2 [Acanthaster planci]